VVGGEKVWNLTFDDDLVIVAKSEKEIKELMQNLGKYVRKKKLEVNVGNTKMMRERGRVTRMSGTGKEGK
jgi:hypothetical protein